MSMYTALSGTLVAEMGRVCTTDDPEHYEFKDTSSCITWVANRVGRIASSRVYAFPDGSAVAQVWAKNADVLYQRGDLSKETRERLISDIHTQLANPLTHRITDAQRALLIQKLQYLMESRARDESAEQSPTHTHRCSTCGSTFSHDAEEEECPEIKGQYYCGACFPTAHEHEHYCPLCAQTWSHYSAPECELGDDATCHKHTSDSHPDARGLAAVAGMVALKTLLYEEVIAPLRDPGRFAKFRITIPNGILMFGPHGCGKTYIAGKLAEELGYFFSEVTASAVGDTYIHGTTGKIAGMFNEAAKNAPAVLFVDEFESLVPDRSQLLGHHDYRVEEISEFLRQLDSAGKRQILVIAATNEPWRIDPAVQRPGRLDKRILVTVPDLEARIDMLRFHLEGRLRETNIPLAALSAALEGYSASDLRLVVEEAARKAVKRNLPITMNDLLWAKEIVPVSISADLIQRYKSFGQRGASST